MTSKEPTLFDRIYTDYSKNRPNQAKLHKQNLASGFGTIDRPKRRRRTKLKDPTIVAEDIAHMKHVQSIRHEFE